MSTPQQPKPPAQQPPAQPPVPEQQKKNIWWIIGLIALIVIGVALAFALFGNQDVPDGPEVVPPPPVPGVPSATAMADVNIRSGPSTSYPSYGVAPVGSVGEVIGVSEDRGWWVIKLPTTVSSNGQGWVSGQYVQVTNAENVPVVPTPPLPPTVEVPPPASNAPTATALDAVYVRSGPGIEYPAYGIAPMGSTGEIVGVSENTAWWAIKLPTTIAPEGYGWVSADWVSVTNMTDVPVIPAPPL